MVGDREPVAPSPPVTTIPRMKDAVAFLAFMRGLVPDSTVSLTLGDSGLTVTISNRVTGRWYGYILDADDLEKPSAGLADELVRIHENRSHGDDKHPVLPHADLERMKARLAVVEANLTAARRWGYLEVKKEYAPGGNVITSEEEDERATLQARAEAERWGAPEPSAADGLPESADECSEDPPVRCGTFTYTAPHADESVAEGSVQVVNTNTATADEREHAGLTLEASQRAFLKAWGWTSNGTGLWADPWKEVVNFAWDSDMAVAEQNNRKEGVSSSTPPLRGKGDARPAYSIADSMERIKLAAQYGHSPVDLTVDLYDAIVAELDRALAAGRP